jgi:CPA1 family monovalent cation:H+ antiporter
VIDPTVLLLGGVLLIVLVASLSHRTGVAPPLILLVVGVAAGYLPGVPEVAIPSSWILDGVLPPLLYAAAITVPVTDFRRNLRAITGLSVVLVLVSTAAVGLLIHLLLPAVPLPAAFAVAAVVSPTDAVAATSIAKRMGLPERLVTVLEGESLVNDATALVLLRSAVATVAAAGAPNGWAIGGGFLYAVTVGVAVGIGIGFATTWVRARLSDPVLTTTVSFIVPFAAFLPAERLGASGVLATVVAGLVTGARGARRFAAAQRVSEHTNWRTVQFVLEQGVFLAMGLELRHLVLELDSRNESLEYAVGIGVVVAALLVVVRAAYIGVTLPLARAADRSALGRMHLLEQRAEELGNLDPGDQRQAERKAAAERRIAQRRADLDFLRRHGFSWRGGVVLSWAGMRGVVTLAAAQSLPDDLPQRPLLVLVAFTVAVVTLLGFGGTLPLVIRATRIPAADAEEFRDELAELMRTVTTSSLRVLNDPEQVRVGGRDADPGVLAALRERYDRSAEDAEEDEQTQEESWDQRRQYIVLRRRMRQAAREELLDARATGNYSSRAITAAQDLLDIEDAREDRVAREL